MTSAAIPPTLIAQTGHCPACGGPGCALCGRSQAVQEQEPGKHEAEPKESTAALAPHLDQPSTALAAVELEAALARQGAGDTDHVQAADSQQEHEHGAEGEESSSSAGSLADSLAPVVEEAATEEEMSAQELAQLRDLQQRDREVRAHEQAHVSAGGQYTSGATFSYETGPDGQQYAVSGEVSIDTSKIPGDPEATEEKARTIRRAALAPASPSGQDMKVASQAANMEAEARMEKMQEEREEQERGEASPLGGADGSAYGADEIRVDPAALAQADQLPRPGDMNASSEPQASGLVRELARNQEQIQPMQAGDTRNPYHQPQSEAPASRLDSLV